MLQLWQNVDQGKESAAKKKKRTSKKQRQHSGDDEQPSNNINGRSRSDDHDVLDDQDRNSSSVYHQRDGGLGTWRHDDHNFALTLHKETRKLSCRKDDRAMRPIRMGALEIFGSPSVPDYAHGYCSQNF